MSADGLNQEQREIVALLQGELFDLNAMAAVFDGDHDDEARQSSLEEFVNTLGHIANAVELAGLLGLADTCRHLNDNFAQLLDQLQSDGAGEWSEALNQSLHAWLSHLSGYLDVIDDQQKAAQEAGSLLDFLSQDCWPQPLSGEQRQTLEERFQTSQFDLKEDNSGLPTTATDEMVSLSMGDDVRAELVDGMLMELPRQSRDFESSVEQFLESRNMDALNQARRMAHTLKGAGNIVGIQGIANLMHSTEDVLELAAKTDDDSLLQDEAFSDLLLDVADTLAMITEYLTGVGPAPEGRVQVLQSVLDYIKALRGEPAGQPVPAQADTQPTEADFDEPLLEESLLEESLDETPESPEAPVEPEIPEPTAETHTPDELPSELADLTFGDQNLWEEDGEIADSTAASDLDDDHSTAAEDTSSVDDNPELDETALAEQIMADLDAETELEIDGEIPANDEEESLSEDDLLGEDLLVEEGFEAELESLAAEESAPESQAAPETLETEAEIAESKTSPSQPAAETAEAEPEEEQHHLSVSLGTAQELLRIAGETQITNSQIESQIDLMRGSVKATEHYQLRLRTMANELETLVQTQNAVRAAAMKYSDTDIDPIELERYSELDTFSNQLLELTTDAHEAIAGMEEQLRELTTISYTQQQLNKDNQNILLRLRMVPVEIMQSRFARCVRQAARMSGKKAKFELHGGSLLVDSMVLNRVVDPLMHLLRNAVDHGLEDDPQQRLDQDKPEAGTISLSFAQQGETLTIHCQDDGRGLDYDSIRQKAMDSGLLSDDDDESNNTLERLIMLPGFSTRASATQTSGRGIGLDAVVSELSALKGTMNIDSTPGDGCCFTLTLPTSILTGHALLIRCSSRFDSQVLGVVSRNIEQIIYVSAEDLRQVPDGLQFDYVTGAEDEEETEQLDVYNMHDLVNLYSDYTPDIGALLITRRPNGERLAIGVESVLASQDLVVKPLNRFVYHPPGTVGATILGDGRVSPVIDLQEMPGLSFKREEWQKWRQQQARALRLSAIRNNQMPLVLVVDDSLSARRSLVQFVTDMGMEAVTAKDGLEAINVINEKMPSLMLVDLEMPRMNGLELTSHLRARDDTKDIPVVMITSRTTEKHRTLALDSGVNSYLNKPWSEEELFSCIQQEVKTPVSSPRSPVASP